MKMKKCEVSGKYVNGKPVVLCEHAIEYVEKQGYKVISNSRYFSMMGGGNVE